MGVSSRLLSACYFVLMVCLFSQPGHSQDFTLRRAIDLALTHSSSTVEAEADVLKSRANYREAHSFYIPQVSLGTSIGYAYGFPLSLEGAAPTIFNVTAQSGIWNAAQRQFIHAAGADTQASKAQERDVRGRVMLDVVSSYVELNRWQRELPVLYSEQKLTTDLLRVVKERVQEGVDAPEESTKARLKAAQSNYRVAQAEGAADILRHHLAELTGVPPAAVVTIASSIPAMPEFDKSAADSDAKLENNDAIDAANLRAQSAELRARGEHKALYPSADFAVQYGLIDTTFTNYEQFFRPGSFTSQNVTFGLVLRLPILNETQKARAQAADADALKARKQAESAKAQVSREAVRLRDTVRELSASRDVSAIQYELAQSQLQAAQTRMQARTATLRELQDASLQAVQYSSALMDSDFEAQRAQLQLMYETGELTNWSGEAK
jgi:outer membrane protein TolC